MTKPAIPRASEASAPWGKDDPAMLDLGIAAWVAEYGPAAESKLREMMDNGEFQGAERGAVERWLARRQGH